VSFGFFNAGEGGTGVVYLAEDTILGRTCPEDSCSSPHRIRASPRRFREEARSAALLNHPAIVKVYKFDQDGGIHYIAMSSSMDRRWRKLFEIGEATGEYEQDGRPTAMAPPCGRNYCDHR